MKSTVKHIVSSELMIWLLLGVIGIYFLYPLRQSLRFGIDLVGGSYLTLEVKTNKAIEAELLNKLHNINTKLSRERSIVVTSKTIENNTIILMFQNQQQTQDATQILKTDEHELVQKVDKNTIVLYFPEQIEKRIKNDAVSRNIEILRTRLDKFSVAEISIAKQGEKEIIIELPDVKNPQEAKEMIGRAALLEFKIVEKIGSSESELLLEYDGDLPDDLQILPGEYTHGRSRSYYVVQKYAKVTGNMLSDARPTMGGKTGIEPVVQFSFNEDGADKFYELTSKNYNRQLAIVLDGKVISAPRINEAIRNTGTITGTFTSDEVKKLAYLLKSGSFVAPVTFEEERQIGPSLGATSIKNGLYSCLGGFALIFLFSLYYYQWCGLLAFLALVYNLILILVGLAWLRATLTLPGIAGMTLTIGMAIDASILIFERIKEEIAQGNSVKNSIDKGFVGAMGVILDGNITTFISGIVLYNLGSGPIQGFAVTLMLGIIATLVATLFFLRSFFKFILNNFSIQKLSI
ncbi:MAG TPA: protein translocase subunit SecD [Candidatus Babeliales bacterium]|nr:protein translocase subunit SecD [Candidatus Babeliales bacterium]